MGRRPPSRRADPLRPALHIDPPLAAIPGLLAAAGVQHFQTTLRNPQRFGNTDVPGEDDQAAFRAAAATVSLWGMVHASLLTNLASPEGRIRNASLSSVLGDCRLARDLGLAAVCFHPGYAKGHATREAALVQTVRKLAALVDDVPEGVCVLLENTCEGSELATDLAELGRLVRDVGVPAARLGVLIDTCHLHAAGFDLSGPGAGERLADGLATEHLLERLVAFHLNDCQGPVGCRRDRHAAPGEGSIGEGLLAIGCHPRFRNIPGILEVSPAAATRGLEYLAAGGALA